jgi:hypothetical protein
MTNRRQSSQLHVISLILALLGLLLLPLMLFYQPPPVIVLPWQTQLVGSIFLVICVLGLIAGITPSHCSFTRRKKSDKQKLASLEANSARSTNIHKEGHHPTCAEYSSHVFTFKGSRYCAGCTGLVTGAIIAIMATILFLFLNIQFIYPEVAFWSGFVFVAIGLLQHLLYQLLKVKRGSIRVVVNVLFVVGSFLVLASVVQLTSNLLLASYLLSLILFWIFTRIGMSRRSHYRICSQCGRSNCPYSEV